ATWLLSGCKISEWRGVRTPLCAIFVLYFEEIFRTVVGLHNGEGRNIYLFQQ
ncbi:unnamed protein product, partial [Prunus brigantina]